MARAMMSDEYLALGRKAQWVFGHLARRGAVMESDLDFGSQHVTAWAEFMCSAAEAVAKRSIGPAHALSNMVYLTYHHPEYPRLANFVLASNTAVVVARDAWWMTEAGISTINIQHTRRIVEAISAGRSILAMMDYCYDCTKSAVFAPFFGYPTRTPTGVLSLAKRYRRGVEALAPDGSSLWRLTPSEVAMSSVESMTCELNSAFEDAIRRDLHRWLLWASVDRRWIGVDYDS